MKLKCDCGNTNPADFRIRETRYVYLHIQEVGDDKGSYEAGEWDTDDTTDSELYCNDCHTVVGNIENEEIVAITAGKSG